MLSMKSWLWCVCWDRFQWDKVLPATQHDPDSQNNITHNKLQWNTLSVLNYVNKSCLFRLTMSLRVIWLNESVMVVDRARRAVSRIRSLCHMSVSSIVDIVSSLTQQCNNKCLSSGFIRNDLKYFRDFQFIRFIRKSWLRQNHLNLNNLINTNWLSKILKQL